MADKINPISQTGEIPRLEPESPRFERESPRPRTLPELKPKQDGSTTGILPILREPRDPSAKRDEDSPA